MTLQHGREGSENGCGASELSAIQLLKYVLKKITVKIKTNKTQAGCKKRSLPELVWQGSHLVLAEPADCVPASDGAHDFFIQTRVPTCMLYPIEN